MSEQIVISLGHWFYMAKLVPDRKELGLPLYETYDHVVPDWSPVWDALMALKASARPEQFDLLTRLHSELDKVQK